MIKNILGLFLILFLSHYSLTQRKVKRYKSKVNTTTLRPKLVVDQIMQSGKPLDFVLD